MSSQYADSSVMYHLVLPLYHVMYSMRYVVSPSRKGQREQVALGFPITEYGQHVLPPSPCPIYPGGISCKGQLTYPRPLEPVASSQIDGRPIRDDAPPLSKSISMAPRPSKYATRQCNTQARSPAYACTAPTQSA